MKTEQKLINTLEGRDLDYAVAVKMGYKDFNQKDLTFNGGDLCLTDFRPSEDWSIAGPIIENERIRIDCPWSTHWEASHQFLCKKDGLTPWMKHKSLLVAAMQCYVSADSETDYFPIPVWI